MPAALPDFSACRVLVAGDAMLDRYWHGAATRISPEAPVPVVAVDADGEEHRAGGAANVAAGVAALGAETALLAPIGRDADGRALERLVRRAGVRSLLLAQPGARTTVKLRITSQRQQLLRLDFERTAPEAARGLRARFRAAVRQCDAVILSDYGKGALADPQSLIALARDAGRPVFVDPKRADFAAYRGATAITPNRRELEAVAGRALREEELADTATALCRRHRLRMLLVTLGEHGMLLQHGRRSTRLRARARHVFDVTGAGDTVIAVFAAAQAAGAAAAEAMHLASLAAECAVGTFGAAVVTAEEIAQRLGEEHRRTHGVLNRRQLRQRMDEAHRLGETVVFANGCFDMLHAGHVDLLQRAAALGDRLVVAVNSDASVRRLKGAGRPLQTLADRQRMLAGLDCVDWVVAFSEPTPEALLRAATPDILVKGADYRRTEVAGREIVEAAGGRVELLELLEGHSTSALVARIRDTRR